MVPPRSDDPCASHDAWDEDEDDGDGGSSPSFRFDVGSGDGALAFPLDCAEASRRASNLGCEFWAVDLPNDGRGTEMSPPAADQQFAVVVANPSGLDDALVTVFLPNETVPVAQAQVPPLETRTLPLPAASIDPTRSTRDGQAYRIESDRPITAYQFNPLDNTVAVYSNDASLLFPTDALGTDYFALTGDAIWLASGPADPAPTDAGAFVAVVATEDGTTVEVFPTFPFTPFTERFDAPIVLDRGQVFTGLSSATSDPGNLSGTRVLADRPVAVFAGNVATVVPSQSGVCCADHIEHQMAPIAAWGSAYAIAPAPSPSASADDPAEYRIVAAYDDTALVYCPKAPPGAPRVLQAAEVARFASDAPFTVRAEDRERPFAIAQFLQSYTSIDDAQPGDPAMLIVPPTAQFQTRYAFVIPAGYAANVITIVRSGDGEVQLDGAWVPDADWQPLGRLGGQTYTYAQRRVGEGSHAVEGTGPLGLSVFGFDEAVSYAFPGGAGMRVIAVPPVAG